MYIKTELYKTFHSKQAIFIFIASFLIVLVIGLTYKLKDASGISAMDLAMISLGNMARSLIYNLFIIMITSLTFAGEFQGNTIKYIFIRPIDRTVLFLSKLVTVWILAAVLLIFICTVSLSLGTIMWGFSPLHGPDGNVLTQGGLRIFLMYLFTWFNVQFFIYFTTTVALFQKIKDQTATIVTTLAIYLLFAISTEFVPLVEKITPLRVYFIHHYLWEKTINYHQLSIGSLVVFGYCIIFFTCSLIKFNREEV
jgi:ABC-2 type transport system permease protein